MPRRARWPPLARCRCAGPEIIIKACRCLADPLASGRLRLLVIGSGAALATAAKSLGSDQTIPTVTAEDPWPNLAFLQARQIAGRGIANENSLIEAIDYPGP